MAATYQNLRAVTAGVEPVSLLPGQLCFNLPDKILYVGDGSDSKTSFDGTQVPGVPGAGWYALPMDFESLGGYFVANPQYYGDTPADQQVLTWNETANHPVWSSSGGGGPAVQVYATTNAAVDAAPGATVSDKISAAIVVSFPEEGDVAVVAGIYGDAYEGLYVYSGTEWIKGAPYASPTDASYTAKGVTQLADTATTKTGTSDTTAVTPKSLQDKVTDDTATTDSNLIASATAVKTVADAAAAAQTLAETGGAISGSTLYVSTLGNDTTAQRGTTKAFATLGAALTAASNGDTIYMSPGTFTENVTLTKGVNLIGSYNDQSALAGTSLVGNFVLDLNSPPTNVSISHIRFKSNNPDPSFRVANHVLTSGATIVSDCIFGQQGQNTTQFAIQTDAVNWNGGLYLRRPDIDGNLKHSAGSILDGANGYLVMEGLEGTGAGNWYYYVEAGNLEIRSASSSISPIYHTGGVVGIFDAINGLAANTSANVTIFGGTGFGYKSVADPVCSVIFKGSNVNNESTVSIGANTVYGWDSLSILPSKIVLDPGAIALSGDPDYQGLYLSQGRPSIDVLGVPDDDFEPSNTVGRLVTDAAGTFHVVTASLQFVAAPTASADAGKVGQVAIDATYLYVHNGTAWTRIALDTTPW